MAIDDLSNLVYVAVFAPRYIFDAAVLYTTTKPS